VGRMPSLISREVARNSYATARDQAVHPGLALRVDDRGGPGAAHPGAGGSGAGPVTGRLAAEVDHGLQPPAGAPDGHPGRVDHEAVYSYVYALPKSELTAPGILICKASVALRMVRRSRPCRCDSWVRTLRCLG
jgi:IS30 family transposase